MPPVEAILAEVEELREGIEERDDRIRILEEKIKWLVGRIYGGGKSEKLDTAQLKLQLEELEAAVAQKAPQRITYERRPTATATEPPAERFKDLPVEETIVIEPEEVKGSPDDYERIGEEETFKVGLHPPKLFKIRIIRPKYRFKADRSKAPIIAPAPARAIEGGYASEGLLAWVVVSKYLHHLPLYRQEKMSKQWGAYISRKTMADWVETVAQWLKPIYNHMRKDLLAGDYLQADETPIRYHEPDQKKGKTQQGWMWLISRPGSDVLFDWRLTRRHGELTSLLDGYEGLLQSDGYEAYARYGERTGVTWIGCWAHARRKVFESLDQQPREANLILKLIARLYACEQRYRDESLAPHQRKIERLAQQKRLLKWIKIAVRVCRHRALPKSRLGLACNYIIGHWKPLSAYINHGQVEIDNNLIENAIRPSAVGKKNFLFIGHPKAGDRSAIIYSIVISCERRGINPLAYIRDVLERLPTMTNQQDLSALTPARWNSHA